MAQATIDKSIVIDAPAATVWDVLTSRELFLDWTQPFNPGGEATVEGDFAPGAEMSFTDQDGAGLKGKVVEYTPPVSLTIEYVAEYFKGEELTDTSREGTWIGSSESYRITEDDGRSTLAINQTLPAADVEHFDQPWDSALARIKELAEGA